MSVKEYGRSSGSAAGWQAELKWQNVKLQVPLEEIQIYTFLEISLYH